jgi:hypothetical protein
MASSLAGALVLARSRWAWVFPIVGIIAATTSIDLGRTIAIWAPETGGRAFDLLVVVAAAGGVAALLWLGPWRRPVRPAALTAPAAAVAVAMAVMTAIAISSIANRYPRRQATDPVAAWASRVPASSIAAWIGNIGDLYGPHAENRVTVMARLDHGAAVPIDTCQGWKQAVVDGRFQYTVVIPGTAWVRWLKADPAFHFVIKDVAASVFQVVGKPDLTCTGQVNSDADFWLAPGFSG